MIDYTKIEFLLDIPLLQWLIDSRTIIEIRREPYIHSVKVTYSWNEIELEVWRNDGIVTLSGSLHKLYNLVSANKGFTNYSDFTFDQLFSTVQYVCETFHINPFAAFIRSVEFGVNIIPPMKSKRLILAARSLKNELPDSKYEDHFYRYVFQQYNFKLYDKAGQYRKEHHIEGELLRLEIHVDRMKFLERYGIRYLADLLNLSKLDQLYEPLLEKINEIQFSPGVYTFPPLSKPEKKIISKLKDVDHIAILRDTNKPKLNYYNRTFEGMLAKYRVPDYRGILSELVYEKWEELAVSSSKTSTDLTGYLSQFPQYLESGFSTIQKGQNFNAFNTSSIGLIELNSEGDSKVDSEPRYCATCGKPLAPDQRPNSKYCSAKYVGYKEAHKCRNMATNPAHNTDKKKNRILKCIQLLESGSFLFDQRPFIKRPPLNPNS